MARGTMAADWPQFRGPNRDGRWEERGILESFPRQGLKIRWRRPVGGGFPPDCTNAPVATWQKLYAEVIAPNCGKSCHNGGNSTQNGGGMDLFPTDQARAWRNLVTQAVKGGYPCTGKAQYRLACPRNAMGACTGPGDPDKSVIYSKLINKPICGNAEPQGTAAGMLYPKAMPFMALPNNQLCDFYTWIKSGAMDN